MGGWGSEGSTNLTNLGELKLQVRKMVGCGEGARQTQGCGALGEDVVQVDPSSGTWPQVSCLPPRNTPKVRCKCPLTAEASAWIVSTHGALSLSPFCRGDTVRPWDVTQGCRYWYPPGRPSGFDLHPSPILPRPLPPTSMLFSAWEERGGR